MPEESQDHQPPAPQRLQSLSSRGRGGMGARGGRFMPNAVGRRSKEDRESSAPAIKPADPGADEDKSKPKFERRAKRQFGTRAEAAGPLAAPIIAGQPSRGGGSFGTVSEGSRARTTIKMKEDPDLLMAFANPGQRIDMSSMDGDDTFPLRMPRDPSQQSTEKREVATGALPGQIVDSNSNDVNLEPEKLYFFQLPELGLQPGPAPVDSFVGKLANKRVSSKSPAPKAAKQTTPDGIKIKSEDVESGTSTEAPPVDSLADTSAMEVDENVDEVEEHKPGQAGRIGTLRTHASGRVTMLLGETVYEIMVGSNGQSAEELLVVDQPSRKAFEVGKIAQRLLVVPDFESLHI